TADLTGDGVEDVIVLQGRGGKGLAQVYDGLTGTRLLQARVGRGAVTAKLTEATGDGLIDLIVRASTGRPTKVIRGGDLAVLPGPVPHAPVQVFDEGTPFPRQKNRHRFGGGTFAE